jgi:SAM-dependent methyltransferase
MNQLNAQLVNEYLDLAIQKKLISNKSNQKFYLNSLFKKIQLQDRALLDVGGGIGLISFYAAVNGAKKVVCLEPESDGCRSGMIDKFYEFKSALSQHLPIEHLPITLQTYKEQLADKFDIVLMHNSINHLDEQACINLLSDKNSYTIYKNLIGSVYDIMKPGGHLIVTDCSCSNFFNSIGAKCPFSPTIEWHKHQMPVTWTKLFRTIGFKNAKVAWKSPNSFGHLGRIFIGNPVMSYFYDSHFKITVQK